jgi:hypothetical protein
MGESVPNEGGRVSLNLRVDKDKFIILEKMRRTGFGIASTERNRSDVYNEVLGYGLEINTIRAELGDRDFEKLWRLIQKANFRKLNLDEIGKFVG